MSYTTYAEYAAHWKRLIWQAGPFGFISDDGKTIEHPAAKRADIDQRHRDEISNGGEP